LSCKRQQIIEVSATLIHSKGYGSTTLNDILDAAQIGKGQFYHYFSTKHELGLAVVDYLFEGWNQRLLENILGSQKDPGSKFNEMLDWVVQQQIRNQAKCGCVFGNLVVEMSAHDEEFRQRLKTIFELWIDKLRPVLVAMIEPVSQSESAEVDKLAQGIVAMLEGGILLMKSKQDIEVLINITDLARCLIKNFMQRHPVERVDNLIL